MKKIYIDGSNLIHRSHWVSKISNVSSLHIFLGSIKKYATMFDTTDMYIAWDGRRDPSKLNFRHELLGSKYKGTRDKEKNYEAFKNVDHADRLTSCLGIANLYPSTLEADDIIAWLCDKFKDDQSIVISTDKDMLQLVSDNVTVYNPTKDIQITPHNFLDVVGVELKLFVKHKAITGDKSDNISGIPKAGPKRASIILEKGVDKLSSEHADIYERNLKLIDLNYSLQHNTEECEYLNQHVSDVIKNKTVNMKEFENGAKYFNLISVMKRINEWKDMFDSEQVNQTIDNMITGIDFLEGFDK